MKGEAVTVSDVADYVGVSRQTIHAWMSERGIKTLPTADRQRLLEKFFGVTWDKIWTLQRMDSENPQRTAVPA